MQNSPSEALKSTEALRELFDSKDTVLFTGIFRRFSKGEIMKALKFIFGATFIVGGLALAGCADDSGSRGGSTGGGNVDDGGSANKFKQSYDLTFNDCPTKKHEFSGDSEEMVKRQYCEALQDHELNNSCAEILRRELFEKQCLGMLWKPKYKKIPDGPAPTPTPNPNPNPDPIPKPGPRLVWDGQKEFTIREQLRFTTFEDSQIVETGAHKELAKSLQQAMMNCGFSYFGPKCLDYKVTEVGVAGFFISYEDGRIDYLSEIKIQEDKYLLRFKVVPGAKVVASHVEVLKVRTSRLPGHGVSYFLNSAHFVPLLTGSIAANTKLEALRQLEYSRNIRSLYHMAEYLVRRNFSGIDYRSPEFEEYRRTRAAVDRLVELNKNLITESEDFLYQEAIILLVLTRSLLPEDSALTLSKQLLSSKSEQVRTIAATMVLDSEPHRIDLKPLVINALAHRTWQVREKSVSAISKTKMTPAEEIQLIGMLADPDSEVQRAAAAAMIKINLTEAHLPQVKSLLSHSNWNTRKEAVLLLGRIGTPAATRELVMKMNDADSDVRSRVVQILKTKAIGEEYLESMSLFMKNSNWAVRRDSAYFIGEIEIDAAIRILIAAIGDHDSEVRSMIFNQLNKKTLTESHLSSLSKNLQSENWSVRRDVVKLLDKVPGKATTQIFIRQLNDSDSDVRRLLGDRLQARKLGGDNVEELALHLKAELWDVRKAAALLLGKIKTPESLAVLESRLLQEKDSDVKAQIVASIKLIKN